MKGVLYIATGKKYIEAAKLSAENTKTRTNLPITLVSDREVESDYFDQIIIDNDSFPSKDPYLFKARNLIKSPYNKTVFLDVDTYLLDDVAEIYNMLEWVEMATAIDANEHSLRVVGEDSFDIPDSFPEFQTGVVAYKNTNAIQELLKDWESIHMKSNTVHDQPTFRAALYSNLNNVNFSPMSQLYNCLPGTSQVNGKVKIIHREQESLEDLHRNENRINRTEHKRVFYSQGMDIISVDSNIKNKVLLCFTTADGYWNLLNRGASMVKNEGIRVTAKRTIKYLYEK